MMKTQTQPSATAGTFKPVDLDRFKEALNIVRTGKDKKGGSYNGIGTLNQAAWIGENSGCLIAEIEHHRNGFNLNRLKAELYEEGRAEHDALVMVAEAAQHRKVRVDAYNDSETSDNLDLMGLAEELLDQALSALAAVKKGREYVFNANQQD